MAEHDNGEALTRRRLRALRQAFAEQLPKRIERIAGAWRRLLDGKGSVTDAHNLQMKVRSLASSSATFGLGALSETARRLEILLQGAVGGAELLDHEAKERIEQGLEDLERVCVGLSGAADLELFDPSTLDLPITSERASRVIFLISRDGRLAADLGFELGCFGFLVRRIPGFEELERHLDQALPAAILLDAEPFEERVVEAAHMDALRRERDESIPLIVLSSRADFESRLQAVRWGAEAYLVKPLEGRRLVDKLEAQLRGPLTEPYRVLIVESDYATGLEYSLALQDAGMITTLVHDPSTLWQELVEARPDLILISLSLEGMSGLHLAAVIRQQDAYLEIPILLLSDDSGLGRQVEAMRVEADDVLVTPVSPELLLSSVGNHVQRARALKRFVTTDSLTGLLGHTSFLESFVLEVDRALANDSPLTFAVIDIDHLNAINETHGHLSGDSTLQSLARLLKQRLRRSDVLSRYGDDEIAVVMPATSGVSAMRVLDSIRGLYAEIREYSPRGSFVSTFSCGAAALPGYDDCATLRQAALEALASARLQGRNRVVLAKT